MLGESASSSPSYVRSPMGDVKNDAKASWKEERKRGEERSRLSK